MLSACRRKPLSLCDLAIKKAEKDAWLLLVKMEREEEERRMSIEAEKRRKIKEQLASEAKLREAAFDGEVDEVTKVIAISLIKYHTLLIFNSQLLKNGVKLEGTDANGETALLEASGGGQVSRVLLLLAFIFYFLSQVESIRILCESGANVNVRGKFQRTPLFRGVSFVRFHFSKGDYSLILMVYLSGINHHTYSGIWRTY